MTRHRPDREVELYREDDEYVVIADVGDFDPDDLTVRWHDGRLSIAAEHRESGERAGVFHHDVSFPRPVEDDGIEATVEDDVLEVTLPIAGEEHEVGRAVRIED